MKTQICAAADRFFGPVVSSECRGGFDFTIVFENIFFSLLPSATLVLAGLIRLYKLHCGDTIVSGTYLQVSKQCIAIPHAIARLAILVLLARSSSYRTELSIPSAAFDLLASLSVCILSYVEGRKALRPSLILNVYLFFSILFDVAQVRTLWLVAEYDAVYTGIRHIAISFSISMILKLALLIVEAIPKQIPEAANSAEEVSGVYSLRSFWWLNATLWHGRYRSLESCGLLSIDSELKTERYSSQLAVAWKEVDQSSKYALLRAVIFTLRWPLFIPAFPRLVLIGFTYAQPLLVKRALDFVEQGSNENIGYGLIGATVFVYCGLAIFNGYYGHLLYRSITIVRGSLIDLIYRKSLKIDLALAQEAAPAGLITADVERIDFTIEKIHSLWASVIELGIAMFLLWREVSWACTAPVMIAILCMFSTSLISKILPKQQKKWNQSIQKRVALTSTMLSNMKTVKMMGLSSYIANILQSARMAELAASETFRRSMVVVNVIVLVPKQLSAPFTFMIFVLAVHKSSGAALSASRAFTILTIIELITTPIGLVLQTIPSITSSLACLDRIQAYLKSVDRTDQRGGMNIYDNIKSSVKITGSPTFASEKSDLIKDSLSIIVTRKASFGYKATGNCVLNSISFTVPRESLTMVVGPVNSGKSTLLKSILGELEVRSGELDVRAERIGYCDQIPWIPNGSIKDCIIGISEYSVSWYDEVVYACALDEDMRSLAKGSDTAIGSRGMALSEGQKQRLALARAIYSRTSLLVLDDVFRSLDSRTDGLIFQRLFSHDGLLKRHSITALLVTHSARHLPDADQIIILDSGSVTQVGTFQNLKGHQGYIQNLALEHQSNSPKNQGHSSHNKEDIRSTTKAPSKKPPDSQGTRLIGTRDKSIYTFYLRPIGILKAAVLLFAVISLAFATRFQRIWVEWWTKSSQQQSMYIGVYFLLAVGACLSFAFFFWWMWMVIVPVTAGGFHEQLLNSIMNAPLSYFTTVDSGTILNRFSQDMAILNGQLPINIFQAISILMICLIQIAFIAYGSKYLATAIPVTLIVVYILSRYYLLTSQQLRLLDISLKAPIYTSLTETKEGLATIRAFGWQSHYTQTCLSRIDESKKAIYLLFMIQRWLNFVLDLIIAGLATVLMTLATQLRHSTNPAQLGVGLSSIIGFSMNISQFIVCYTELENSLGAISRIKECVEEIESEDPPNTHPPPKDWPINGAIEFRKVTAYYNDHENPALSEISLTIQPRQKVLLCGRTGSGKTTLLSLLLRLLIPQSGEIYIDNLDMSTLPSQELRERITVIPQTPFFLPSSIRESLSPSTNSLPTHTDATLLSVLSKTGLKDIVESHGGLDAQMKELGLSHGQQQLFCLATALLKKSKIVLIDEVTSGVDAETERRMCDLMRDEFEECTVISIAHRLERVEGFDLVIVLSRGRIVEMGEPGVLIREREGVDVSEVVEDVDRIEC